MGGAVMSDTITDPAELIALLDEADPIERAFQALVIEHPEHLTPDEQDGAL